MWRIRVIRTVWLSPFLSETIGFKLLSTDVLDSGLEPLDNVLFKNFCFGRRQSPTLRKLSPFVSDTRRLRPTPTPTPSLYFARFHLPLRLLPTTDLSNDRTFLKGRMSASTLCTLPSFSVALQTVRIRETKESTEFPHVIHTDVDREILLVFESVHTNVPTSTPSSVSYALDNKVEEKL